MNKVIVFSVLVFCSCGPKERALNSTFQLSHSELIDQLNRIALDGDKDAAFTVAQYYLYCQSGSRFGIAYLKKSAELGNQKALSQLEIIEKSR